MIDAQKLLDQFLGTGSAVQDGAAPSRTAEGGSLQDQIGGLLQGDRGSMLKGALAGGLATYLLSGKRGRKLGGKAIKYGGMALVAGVAYKAWQNYQAKQTTGSASAAASPALQGEIPMVEGTSFHPLGEAAGERASLMLSAMIAAAKADGYIDADEQDGLFGKIADLDLGAEEKGLLMDQMRRPLSIDELVERVPDEATAAEVYTVSLLAIDPDHPAEKAYLDMLAARLNLPGDLVASIRDATDEVQE
ncbi:tellurite resistance TerB family protein [Consotaella aegiceratis]|uniref:tellurite resistance TerB family protein n=1 Tax=Consotaella aegiceratis TaxID=3097961 RepID=UPI002F424D72